MFSLSLFLLFFIFFQDLDSSEIPSNPFMESLENSKKTFVDKGWNHSILVSTDELSKAGFYYTGILDEVECFHCSVCILDWDDNDWGDSVNSMVTHKMISQNCYFLKVKQMQIFLCEKQFIDILFD